MTQQSQNLPSKLQAARALCERKAWAEAYAALRELDEQSPLELPDLWWLSWSAGLSGHEPEAQAVLERIYQQESEHGMPTAAARAAFWIGFRALHVGELSRSGAWLARAERQVERAGDCVERGYLELPSARKAFQAGDYEAARAAAARAVEIGERFQEPNLASFARNIVGRSLIRLGAVEAGLKLHDEAMLAVSNGELQPIMSGLVYCSAIDSCQSIYEVGRMREWTESLSAWCDAQPQLKTFTGECLLCRAEVMELGGEWSLALEEARRASERLRETYGPRAAGMALYRQAEIHRLRGELSEAEERYREASQAGRDPQPGHSLLRLAQGRSDVALQALRRALAEARDPLARAGLLPALVEACTAGGALDEAAAAAAELAETAATFASSVLGAHAAKARGTVDLARGEPAASAGWLRQAFDTWQQMRAPYQAAQTRVLLACAYQAMGDEDGALLEIEAARRVFEQLGATLELSAIDNLAGKAQAPAHESGLSTRELEVLRLVATGKTNKLIARELCLSEKTVDRHVSNILAKLSVPSRAAATAYAYEHKLL